MSHQHMHRRASDSARGRPVSRPRHNEQCSCSVMQLMTAYCATTVPYGYASRRQRLPSAASKQMQQWQWQKPTPPAAHSRQGSLAYASSTHRPSVASIASSVHSRNMSVDDQGRVRKQRINSVASSHYSPRQLSMISNVVTNSEQQFQERRRKSSLATNGFLSGGLPTPPAEDDENGLDALYKSMPPRQRKLSNFLDNPEIIEVEEARRPVHRKSFKFKTPARPPVLRNEASITSTTSNGSATSEIHDVEDVKSTMSFHPSSILAPASSPKLAASSPSSSMPPPPIPAIPAAYASFVTPAPLSPPLPTAAGPSSPKIPNFSYRIISSNNNTPITTPSAIDDDDDDADASNEYFPLIHRTIETTHTHSPRPTHHHHHHHHQPQTQQLPTRSKRAATFSSSSSSAQRPIVTPHAVIRPPPPAAFVSNNTFDFGFGESTLTTTITGAGGGGGGGFYDDADVRGGAAGRKKKGLRERLLGGKLSVR